MVAGSRVPGFGPVFQSKLMNWRKGIEMRFIFNPAKPIDQSHFLKIDQDIQKARADLQNKLEKALAELKQANQQIIYSRQMQEPIVAQSAQNSPRQRRI
jgi:hypothetical protein